MTDNALKLQAFKLKGRLYTLTVLQLMSTGITLFAQQLEEAIAKAPKLLYQTPVILDCTDIGHEPFDLPAFCQCLREHALFPVGIQGCDEALAIVANSHDLAVLHASTTHDKPLIEEPEPQVQMHAIEALQNKLITTPVRSGQQMVCKGGDLVIAAPVSRGAELLADGNIHVYGPLRGRALAGLSGDKHARIFCQSLEAELVSIAGFYRLSEAIVPQTGPCQIFLQDEHICIEPIC